MECTPQDHSPHRHGICAQGKGQTVSPLRCKGIFLPGPHPPHALASRLCVPRDHVAPALHAIVEVWSCALVAVFLRTPPCSANRQRPGGHLVSLFFCPASPQCYGNLANLVVVEDDTKALVTYLDRRTAEMAMEQGATFEGGELAMTWYMPPERKTVTSAEEGESTATSAEGGDAATAAASVKQPTYAAAEEGTEVATSHSEAEKSDPVSVPAGVQE